MIADCPPRARSVHRGIGCLLVGVLLHLVVFAGGSPSSASSLQAILIQCVVGAPKGVIIVCPSVDKDGQDFPQPNGIYVRFGEQSWPSGCDVDLLAGRKSTATIIDRGVGSARGDASSGGLYRQCDALLEVHRGAETVVLERYGNVEWKSLFCFAMWTHRSHPGALLIPRHLDGPLQRLLTLLKRPASVPGSLPHTLGRALTRLGTRLQGASNSVRLPTCLDAIPALQADDPGLLDSHHNTYHGRQSDDPVGDGRLEKPLRKPLHGWAILVTGCLLMLFGILLLAEGLSLLGEKDGFSEGFPRIAVALLLGGIGLYLACQGAPVLDSVLW